MKAVLAVLSLVLTIIAVILTGRVMSPPPPPKDTAKADPLPLESEHRTTPALVSAGVEAPEVERLHRQNLFHPDRTWLDPNDKPPVIVDSGAGGGEEPPPKSDAENFELLGLLSVGDRAAAAAGADITSLCNSVNVCATRLSLF